MSVTFFFPLRRHFYTLSFCMQLLFRHTGLLHTEAFAQKCFTTQNLFHTGTVTRRLFDAQHPVHTDTFCTRGLSRRDGFTHRTFTQTILKAKGKVLTHGNFYTETFLSSTQHAGSFHRASYPQSLLHFDALYTHTHTAESKFFL